MAHTAPGKAYRKGITMIELGEMFPDEQSARQWFEKERWGGQRCCPRCGSIRTSEADHHKTMPYRCKDCHGYFSVRTGTLMESSKVPLKKWVWAIYLHLTNLKGISSMKLHRDIGVSQPTAWFMLQRIRKAFDNDDDPPFGGPVEMDETYVGGKERNKHNSRKANQGRGPVGKVAVVGAKDRETNKVKARVVEIVNTETIVDFVSEHVREGATLYTDSATSYNRLAGIDHHAVNHSVGEFVKDMVHTNGVESFWALLKRAHKGVYHKISPKHLHRYVMDFAGKHGIRPLDTIAQMSATVDGMNGKRLKYRELVS